MSYISRSANRFYAAVEAVYGTAAAVTAEQRLVASQLRVQQISPASRRRDKTGSRSSSPAPCGGLQTNAYQLSSYLTSLAADGSVICASLLEAGCGAAGVVNSGLTVAAAIGPNSIQTTAPHGLSLGSGVSYGGEIRFVTGTPNPTALQLNVPFTSTIQAGATLGTTTTFRLGNSLSGVTLYDYWDPQGAISRILIGATVDTISIDIHGDRHELTFSGRAADVLDSQSFATGSAGLQAFPEEPSLTGFSYSIVPGQLGQAWLGVSPQQFFTLTDGQVRMENNIALRETDVVGAGQARALSTGIRQVSAAFTLLAQDDAQTNNLYQIARQRGTISVLLQLGRQTGRMMAMYLPAVRPQVPVFDDSTERLTWRFSNNLAEGLNNDELFIAFG